MSERMGCAQNEEIKRYNEAVPGIAKENSAFFNDFFAYAPEA